MNIGPIPLELVCAAIVTTWIVMRLRRESSAETRRSFALRLAFVAAAAWVGEESCIRLYGFYGYASSWSAFLDKVPLAIVCIWPVVVVSALDLARSLLPASTSWKRAVLVMLLVIADASLIEPIAVRSGLWSWTEPGPFTVPIVGILGWGFFAFGVALVLERATSAVRFAAVLVAGPVPAHVLLLASWWLALRWLPRGTDETPFVVVAWLLSIALAARVLRGPAPAVALADLLLRVPAAAFFFVLLALHARDDVKLIAYAVAFAPPYLALTFRAMAQPRLPTMPTTTPPRVPPKAAP